jgi:membrane fusion protein (multidrug efflux system)
MLRVIAVAWKAARPSDREPSPARSSRIRDRALNLVPQRQCSRTRGEPGTARGPAPFHYAWVILVLAVSTWTGCQKGPEKAPSESLAPVSVRLAKVESRRRVATEEVVGSVRAKLHSTIEAKISGRIEQMLVVPGQVVKAGDLLAQLDAREVKARLDQALAVREQAEQELRRATELLKQQVASQQEFDAVQSRARVAAASVTEAETMMGYAKVIAPFAGIVTRKLADVGDLAAPGKALLEMEDPSVLRLEADVPEALIDRVVIGSKFSIRVSSLTNVLEGVSSEITPVSDPSSRTFLVKFDLPPAAGLRVGQFGRVLIPVGEAAALRVPAAALVQRGQMELVFVVTNARAQLRLVKTGKRIGDEVEVVSGIEAGEQIVCEGATNLSDGQEVEVR